MTEKNWRKLSGTVLFLIISFYLTIFFIGCSSKSVIDIPIYHIRPSIHKIIIESPPVRIVYVGSINKESNAFVNECLVEMRKREYHNYKFNNSFVAHSNLDIDFDESTSRIYTVNRHTKVKK